MATQSTGGCDRYTYRADEVGTQDANGTVRREITVHQLRRPPDHGAIERMNQPTVNRTGLGLTSAHRSK